MPTKPFGTVPALNVVGEPLESWLGEADAKALANWLSIDEVVT